MSTPSELIANLPEGDTWSAQSKRSVSRLRAYFLVCEDPQRRLDARDVRTLAHQVSLVRHIVEQPHLRNVLIADEVGLGKTIEVGLLLGELLDANKGQRVLYLAPARLVSNVRREFDRLGLGFRQWTAMNADARLNDPRIVASIHKAVFGENAKHLKDAGPWDIIIVDECHHLSAWAPGGGDRRENFALVRELISQQPPDGRVILMSGTPHQGHPTRFENLLGLLRRQDEPPSALAGRVIYRTKQDVSDWDGSPLFPLRDVRQPIVFDPGAIYREWIHAIHDFYHPTTGGSDATRRAAGWRCAQALQWAASSPQAGLGYLVRQAMRAGWELDDGCLREAIASLRPYRGGLTEEPIGMLFGRIKNEIERQASAADVDDIEDDTGGGTRATGAERHELNTLLQKGIQLIARDGDSKWGFLRERVLACAGGEKHVLFAQPIETVSALAQYLRREFKEEPAIIIGGQSDADRQAQIDRFWRSNGPRFLVSSRAGGEGINLQVAHRLVHVDVPWNPMELEQRVGRVHRFGSRETVIVDTVVMKGSREEDVYRVAREKLRLIASTLVAPEKFEMLFSRVMSLIPPEDLQTVLIQAPTGPLNPGEQAELAGLVRHGFTAWNSFNERFAAEQKKIRQQDPGLAAWADVEQLLVDTGAAKSIDGFEVSRFESRPDGVVALSQPARAIQLEGGEIYVVGDYGSAQVHGPGGESTPPLGLNTPRVSELLRRLAIPDMPTGAAHLRWPAKCPSPNLTFPFGVLVFVRQTVRNEKGAWIEQGSSLHCFVIGEDGEAVAVQDAEKGLLLRGVFESTVRIKPDSEGLLVAALRTAENRLLIELRRATEEDIERRVRFAAMPVFAAVVGQPG
jgi:superfamily II DNA or RNA helicase